MSTADNIRKAGRLVITLPELQEDITVRTYHVREMLLTGIGGRIRDFVSDDDAVDSNSKKILQDAKDTLIACSISPKIVYDETTRSGYLCIDDIPDGDILHAFSEIITVDDSRFFGTNRTAFGGNDEAYARVIDGQQRICYQIDGICARYGIDPRDIERWTDDEFVKVLAIFEGAEAYRAAHPPEKDK